MFYKDFNGKSLSLLGLGCMRFPTVEGTGEVDLEKTERIIDLAMEKGINYYDTAWGYLSGKSEEITGRMLKKYPRDSYYIATKFPGFSKELIGKAEEVFETQLARLGMDYVDFYLFHNVCEADIDNYLDNEKYGHFSYILEQKKKGRIKHLGFSTHGTLDTVKRFLDAYGEHIEFCQIQLNFLDYYLQDARAKVELLNERNIPIWVMEPLRGGRMASLVDGALSGQSVPSWAFRYLFGIEGVGMILSGMSDTAQVTENANIFSQHKPLDADEAAALEAVTQNMLSKKTLPCTGCRYCTDGCPMGLDIPLLIGLYNDLCFNGHSFVAETAVANMPVEKRPGACIGCRACEDACPQNIKISEAMADFAKRLEKIEQ